jgi:hypothetical protein
VLLAAPVLALMKHRHGTREGRAYFGPVAEELTRRWRAMTDRPLTIVLGDHDTATAAAFYAPDHPDTVLGFDLSSAPWVTRERMAREGFAAICKDESCATHAQRLAAGHTGAQRVAVEVTRSFLGSSTPPGRFILVLAPPNPAAQ